MTYIDAAKLIATWIDTEHKSIDRTIQRSFYKLADMLTNLEHDWDEAYGHINGILDRLAKLEERVRALEPEPISIKATENKDNIN